MNSSENLSALLDKRSVPVVLPKNDNIEQQSVSLAECSTTGKNVRKDRMYVPKQRLPVFKSKLLHYRTKKL